MVTREEFITSLASRSPSAKIAERAAMLESLFDERGKDGGAQKRYESGLKLYLPVIEKAESLGGMRTAQMLRVRAAMEDAAVAAAKDPKEWERACQLQEVAYSTAQGILSGLKIEYNELKKRHLKDLKDAIVMTEIGGGAIANEFGRAEKAADNQQWTTAIELLQNAAKNALLVNERAPYIKSRRANGPALKAAFAITFKGYGAKLKSGYDEAEDLASNGKFAEAFSKMEETAAFLKNTVQADGELKQKRDEVQTLREQNTQKMSDLMKAPVLDVKALEELVRLELIGKKEDGSATPALAKQAAQFGDDPGANTRGPVIDAGKAEKTFKDHDWFELKTMLHENKISKDDMWDLWRFRQKYVTELIDSLRSKYPTLITKASGSTDLESDIDVTVASAKTGEDVAASKEFNDTVKRTFGKPPGRVFDVNMYPRNYSAIEETFNPDFNLSPIKDKDIHRPTDDMKNMSRIDQDVASLLKQRRFVDAKTFGQMLDNILSKAPDEKTKKQIEKQFEEGEDIYLMTSLEKIQSIATTLQLNRIPYPKLLEELFAMRNKEGVEAMKRVQELIPDVLDLLEEKFPAEVMQTTDDMYLQKTSEIREKQEKIAQLDKVTAPPESHHPDQTCEELHAGVDHIAWVLSEAQRMKAEVMKDQFTTILFANEAYLTEGAIEHVVGALQASSPEKTKALIEKLTPDALLQSSNEQLADFFKDMKSYSKKVAEETDDTKKRREVGEAFVHASKYLVRLLNAAELLLKKYEKAEPPIKFDFFGKLKAKDVDDPTKLKARVEELLLAMRKSSTIPAEVKGEVGVVEVERVFGVSDIAGFQKLIAELGMEINEKVRSREDFVTDQTVDRDTERTYFGVPPAPTDFNEAHSLAEAAMMELQELQEEIPADGEHPKQRQVQLSRFEEALDRARMAFEQLDEYDTDLLPSPYVQDREKLLKNLEQEIKLAESRVSSLSS